jgi:hypothetical protein
LFNQTNERNQINETNQTNQNNQPVLTLHGYRERRMGKGASLGKKAVLADSGRAGEKSDFFSILLGKR